MSPVFKVAALAAGAATKLAAKAKRASKRERIEFFIREEALKGKKEKEGR
jgi:hypothetical protein